MYRNLYDTDCTTWSPQGRIHQIEYAMEAVKNGTCVVGLKSKEHAVLCSLKRPLSKLASAHKKLYKIDDHIGVGASGITSDAKVLCTHMRNDCLTHKYVYDSNIQVTRLATQMADRSQVNTQRYGKRPFGVGLLVAGCDSSGAKLLELCPSGNVYEYYAMAIGARSQSSKTYLEKHFETFSELNADELIKHAVKALQASIAQDQELTSLNVAIGIVGVNQTWKELDQAGVQSYLDAAGITNDAPMTD